MGIHAVARPQAPEPKATCPSCQRPIVVLKSGKCLYCGNPIPGAIHAVEAKPGVPPELMFALQPREAQVSNSSKWIRRFIAAGVASILIAFFVRACMKT